MLWKCVIASAILRIRMWNSVYPIEWIGFERCAQSNNRIETFCCSSPNTIAQIHPLLRCSDSPPPPVNLAYYLVSVLGLLCRVSTQPGVRVMGNGMRTHTIVRGIAHTQNSFTHPRSYTCEVFKLQARPAQRELEPCGRATAQPWTRARTMRPGRGTAADRPSGLGQGPSALGRGTPPSPSRVPLRWFVMWMQTAPGPPPSIQAGLRPV